MSEGLILVRDGDWAAERAKELILWAGYPEARPEHVQAVAAFLLHCEHDRERRVALEPVKSEP